MAGSALNKELQFASALRADFRKEIKMDYSHKGGGHTVQKDYDLLTKITSGKSGVKKLDPSKKLQSGYKMPSGEQGYRRPMNYKKPKGMSGRY